MKVTNTWSVIGNIYRFITEVPDFKFIKISKNCPKIVKTIKRLKKKKMKAKLCRARCVGTHGFLVRCGLLLVWRLQKA